MARGKAGRPLGLAMLELSTCGVKTADGEAESETWHDSVSWWGWCMGECTGVGWGSHPPVHPLISSWLPPLTLHYLQVLSGWRHKLLSALNMDGFVYTCVCLCVCVCSYTLYCMCGCRVIQCTSVQQQHWHIFHHGKFSCSKAHSEVGPFALDSVTHLKFVLPLLHL